MIKREQKKFTFYAEREFLSSPGQIYLMKSEQASNIDQPKLFKLPKFERRRRCQREKLGGVILNVCSLLWKGGKCEVGDKHFY